jgi:hypothetical protein
MARRWQGPIEMALLLDTLGQLPELVRGFWFSALEGDPLLAV